MNEPHIEALTEARRLLVGHRRALVKILSTATDNRSFDARGKLVELQAAIEAIDRAIIDESAPEGAAGLPLA